MSFKKELKKAANKIKNAAQAFAAEIDPAYAARHNIDTTANKHEAVELKITVQTELVASEGILSNKDKVGTDFAVSAADTILVMPEEVSANLENAEVDNLHFSAEHEAIIVSPKAASATAEAILSNQEVTEAGVLVSATHIPIVLEEVSVDSDNAEAFVITNKAIEINENVVSNIIDDAWQKAQINLGHVNIKSEFVQAQVELAAKLNVNIYAKSYPLEVAFTQEYVGNLDAASIVTDNLAETNTICEAGVCNDNPSEL